MSDDVAGTPPRRRRAVIQRMDGVVLIVCCFGVVLFQQFKAPLERYTGVKVSFKTPSVLRPTPESLLQQEMAKNYSSEHDIVFEDTDDTFLSSDEDGSHDTIAKWLYSPAIKIWEEYQYHNSHYRLMDELEDCRERTNTQDHEMIHTAINWCPELAHRKFMLVPEPKCNSPLALLEQYLHAISWAMVTNRTVLIARDLEEDSVCKNVFRIDESIPFYTFWQQQLNLTHAQTWDIAKIDHDGADVPQVIKLDPNRPAPRLTGSLRLASVLLNEAMGRRVESIDDDFVEEEALSFLYGMILDETLMFDESTLVDSVLLAESQMAENDDDSIQRRESFHLYASLRLSASGAERGYIDEACVDRMQLEDPLSSCVVFDVVGKFAGESEPPQVSTCVVHDHGFDPQNFVPSMAFAAQARHGIILPRSTEMNSDEIAFATLVTELITYRGRLEHNAQYALPVCRAT